MRAACLRLPLSPRSGKKTMMAPGEKKVVKKVTTRHGTKKTVKRKTAHGTTVKKEKRPFLNWLKGSQNKQ